MKECLLSGYNNNVELVRGMLGVFIMLCRIGANITCLNNKMLYSKKRRRKKVKNKIKCSLRSKRFQSSYCAKVRAGAKKKKVEGGG